MNCPEERIVLYWARELDSSEMEAVAAHLTECGKCRKVLSDIEAVGDLSADITLESPEKDLAAGAMRSARQTINFPLPALLATAAAILILVVGAVALRQGRSSSESFTETPTTDELSIRIASVRSGLDSLDRESTARRIVSTRRRHRAVGRRISTLRGKLAKMRGELSAGLEESHDGAERRERNDRCTEAYLWG